MTPRFPPLIVMPPAGLELAQGDRDRLRKEIEDGFRGAVGPPVFISPGRLLICQFVDGRWQPIDAPPAPRPGPLRRLFRRLGLALARARA